MSQKIVIKANVKREPQNSLPTVSYEWHWRRIVSLAMLIVMTSAAVIYGLTSSVNADQGAHPNEQTELLISNSTQSNEVIESPIHDEPNSQSQISAANTDGLTAKQMVSAEDVVNIDISNKSNPEPVTVQPELDNVIVALQAAELANTSNSEIISSTQNSDAQSEVNPLPEQSADIDTLLDAPQSDDVTLFGTDRFPDNAHIASVALGAQIDTGKISRAVLTRSVEKREPVNVFAADVRMSQFEGTLSFFSELKGLQGQQVKHIWYFESETMAEITLNVTSPRYRTYSTKNIMNTQTGHWRVDVVDEQGNLIAQKEFRVLAN
ncbi:MULTISPECIES: DUF2914 domain-containing protein [unclassified Pseudoalteromonas]|uniref:DUF2914 domain-containing protein n=1 Tax=unclassified Pseudoalteromonas TaxID=194690 RepID=UPI000730FF35|nr:MULTISPECIES: DUF2914 domain-containing protein [unclassified Pseudoalteromonas]KTD98541.1 hypothetical protein ATS71_11625 [Pseudoalteromonas sp. H71]MBW4967128.1 DUF2914 domain-containing protein [Pseudoalteromonas sp. CR1]TMN79194.1 DUF2914 domain-containing protein [Pseudoalteromonas sp. S410]TMN88807.1 DUF2914 domain-containing protein [Pseudoalteromonas sp. S408]TMN98951.1 DUF2914 domain-containing protein [Pseudoalteromonas sp. S407]